MVKIQEQAPLTRENGSKESAAGGCDPLLLLSGHRASQMIKEGQLSSVRLCQAYIERIRQVQPKINCMASERFGEALREAAQIDELVARYRDSLAGAGNEAEQALEAGFTAHEIRVLRSALCGVPVTIKESIMVKGMRNSCGLWERRNTLAERDAVVVANLRAQGLVPLCTTNVPELTFHWADCNNKVYGRSLNPYDRDRVTGASSGGEGGLLGAAGSLVGVGSDIGGSLRTPAHFCGVNSHKPSPFLVSSEGNWPPMKEARLRLFTLGPMARYASDLRPMLSIMLSDADNPLRDSYTTHQPEGIAEKRQRLVELLAKPQAGVDLSQLRLFYSDSFEQVNPLRALVAQREPRVQSAILEAQRELVEHLAAKFGCETEQLDLDRYLRSAFDIWRGLLACGATVDHETAFEKHELRRAMGANNLALEMAKWAIGASNHTKDALLIAAVGVPGEGSRRKAHAYCSKAERLAAELRSELLAKLGPNGVIIMPTLPRVALRHGQALLNKLEARYPAMHNNFGLPVTQAAIRLDREQGLPLGLSIVSAPYNDHLTLAVAEEIESSSFGGWTPPAGLLAGKDKARSK